MIAPRLEVVAVAVFLIRAYFPRRTDSPTKMAEFLFCAQREALEQRVMVEALTVVDYPYPLLYHINFPQLVFAHAFQGKAYPAVFDTHHFCKYFVTHLHDFFYFFHKSFFEFGHMNHAVVAAAEVDDCTEF